MVNLHAPNYFMRYLLEAPCFGVEACLGSMVFEVLVASSDSDVFEGGFSLESFLDEFPVVEAVSGLSSN